MSNDTPTRIRTGIIDGVPYEWWADDRRPASVTVRSAAFRTVTKLTSHDPAWFAAALVRKLLAKRHERAGAPHRPGRSHTATVPVLKKPGWFEVDPSDFGTTVF
jgi:hypothetical protein